MLGKLHQAHSAIGCIHGVPADVDGMFFCVSICVKVRGRGDNRLVSVSTFGVIQAAPSHSSS